MTKIFILKKTHTVNGNPNYKLFIPSVNKKVNGLRKHKEAHTYGIISYNLKVTLNKMFPNVVLIDKYGDII